MFLCNNNTYGNLPTPGAPTGYSFAGWYTAATGGTQVSASTRMSAGNTTVYAHWAANSYTLTFNANGGTVSETNRSVIYNTAYGNLPTPTRDGYNFLGWYTASSGGVQVSASTVMGAGNATVYAQWSKIPIVVQTQGTGKVETTIDTTGFSKITVTATGDDCDSGWCRLMQISDGAGHSIGDNAYSWSGSLGGNVVWAEVTNYNSVVVYSGWVSTSYMGVGCLNSSHSHIFTITLEE